MIQILLLVSCSLAMFCNYYPLDPVACITKTEGVMCQFSHFENACIKVQSSNIGCSPQLNKLGCINQQTNYDGSEAKCKQCKQYKGYFGKRCMEAKEQYLINLGCSSLFSQNACTSVVGMDCLWDGNQCKELSGENIEVTYCSQAYNAPVTPSACTKIKGVNCKNGGFENNYGCVNVKDSELAVLQCNTKGLNEDGCVRISGYKCMFIGGQCIEANTSTSCELSMNKNLCLSITNPNLQCQWYKNRCQNVLNGSLKCSEFSDVSPSICAALTGHCQYKDQKCIVPTNPETLKCKDLGLSRITCTSIKGDYCSFVNNLCEQLTTVQLNQVQCNDLNEDACVNVTTQFQYCRWTGNECVRMFINQDVDCPLLEDGKFNGNVCQAISKTKCRYNIKTHLCQKSVETDTCTSSYINLIGCVAVTNAACQWTNNGCIDADIVQEQTSCLDLGYANSVACSQILKSDEVGCYYNVESQQCNLVNDQIISEVQCGGMGLNRVGCASVQTTGQICRWFNNKCMQIKNKLDVQAVYCLQMQYVNAAACALIEAGKEVCRYKVEAKGCVNSLDTNSMECDEPGLNTYACALIQLKSCYYDKVLWQCKQIEVVSPNVIVQKQTAALLYTSDCVNSSPTPDVCRSITKPGEKCTWLYRQNRCANQYVSFNESCLDYNSAYTSKTILVNANVCASIEMEQPNYDAVKGPLIDKMKGYCIYEGGNCAVFKGICATPCCNEFVGINAHVCGKYSTGKYCYFGNDLKCTELTMDTVDINIEKQVKDFYNAQQLKCSSMNKNSCHMLEWSTQQKCYFNGELCVSVNFNAYPDLSIFTSDTQILNKYACLSIEAMKTETNSAKFFGYLDKHCADNPDILDTTDCSSTEVNSNACLRKYEDIYCRWSKSALKCLNLDEAYVLSLSYCDQYVNEAACVQIPNAGCFFSYLMDKCVVAPQMVECGYFGSARGTVSRLACLNIKLDGQICGYDDKKHVCKDMSVESDSCDLPDGNAIACFAKTKGDCLWNSEKMYCYENDKQIDSLGCEDNVNYQLCMKITSQPCEWDILKMKCLKMKSNQYQLLIDTNLYNPEACAQVFGKPYIYDPVKHTCTLITQFYKEQKKPEDPLEPAILCDGSMILNADACLFGTMLQRCYFDQSQSAAKRCQKFTGIQTSCESPYLISLQMCAEVPQSCYFVVATYECKYIRIDDSVKCSDLRDQSSTYLYNKISCASINYEFAEYAGTKQCLKSGDPKKADDQFMQQCQVEKYCKWDQGTTTCAMLALKSLEWLKAMVPVVQSDGTSVDQEKQWCEDTPIAYKDDCRNIYSKGACLQLSAICAFDITMGGCFEIAGNEQQILSCEDVIGDNCSLARNANAPCMIDDASNLVYPKIDTCNGFPNQTTQNCKQTAPTKCSDAKSLGSVVSPSVCSRVTDNCYYDGKLCNSDTKKKKCDETFSQKACLSNGCDFTLGFCQQTFSVPSFDTDNPFYLFQCQYINKLPITALVKGQICSQMNFPCAFQTEQCVAAAQVQCTSIAQIQVSLLTCVLCIEGPYSYSSSDYMCNLLTSHQSGCQNTNRFGCLSMTTNKNCAWTSKCVEQSDEDVKKLNDCSLTNTYGCPKINNACWVSPTSKLCDSVNIFSDCTTIAKQKGNQMACLISNLSSCKWNIDTCTDYPVSSTDCSVANKYGCLNLSTVACGWSEEDKACFTIEFKGTITKCTEFFDNGESLIKFNAYACQQITDVPCFRDRTQKCNVIGPKDIITCETPGLNKLGCILQSTGYCEFVDGKCQSIMDISKVKCSTSLNKVACFSLTDTCKFDNNECNLYDVSLFTTIAQITAKKTYPYSPSVCRVYKELEGQILQLYYGDGFCIDANKPKPFLYSCNAEGLNEITCLKQTKPICQYVSETCVSLTTKQINAAITCDPSFNWNACQSLKSACKFYQNKCQPVLDTESCESLVGIIASPMACSSRSQDVVACIFDSKTYTCIKSTETKLSCNQSGLNKFGCQMNTELEFCRYNPDSKICIATYETTLTCSHLVNKNKCLFIKTPKQYCKFLNNTCRTLDPLDVVGCYNTTPTNPMTCTASESVACIYDRTTQKCVSVAGDMDPDEPWSNAVSFNKLACMKYVTDQTQVIYTTNGCTITDTQDLINLTCDQPVNMYTCSQITNPTQFCLYKDYKCQYIHYTAMPVKLCASIGYINRLEYCEQATDVACKYNSFTKLCDVLDLVSEPITSCARGLNKVACESLATCQFDQYCLEKTATCTGTSGDCANVRAQPCKLVGDSCTMATNLETLDCNEVANKVACVQLSKQYCQFSGGLCTAQELIKFKSKKCEEVTNINSAYFCEQPDDIPCRYLAAESRCTESLATDNLDCIRGLNEYACLNYTKQALRCRFSQFCFGPTQIILDCNNTLFDCCNKALDKNTCLLQNILTCQWTGTQCVKYTDPITTCTTMANTSKLSCVSSTDLNCVLDFPNAKCIQILTPQSCDQLQSEAQCSSVDVLPCVWEDESCKYHIPSPFEECQDIASGSKRACLNVIRAGQMCQFLEGKCKSYNHTTDECLENINKIACTNQATTKCIWKISQTQIKPNYYTDLITIDIGTCVSYNESNVICTDNLSYLTCLGVKTVNQFCKWLNGKCTQIDQTIAKVTPSTHILVNVNACALVTSEPVQYNPKSSLCIAIQSQDVITCYPPTPGLNMRACLAIHTQRCKWNYSTKQCELSQSKIYLQL